MKGPQIVAVDERDAVHPTEELEVAAVHAGDEPDPPVVQHDLRRPPVHPQLGDLSPRDAVTQVRIALEVIGEDLEEPHLAAYRDHSRRPWSSDRGEAWIDRQRCGRSSVGRA